PCCAASPCRDGTASPAPSRPRGHHRGGGCRAPGARVPATSWLRSVKNQVDAARELRPLRALGGEPLAAGAGHGVVARRPVVLRGPPLRREPPARDEPVERRIERALVDA